MARGGTNHRPSVTHGGRDLRQSPPPKALAAAAQLRDDAKKPQLGASTSACSNPASSSQENPLEQLEQASWQLRLGQ